jgi:PAS domain S-box-containing protein
MTGNRVASRINTEGDEAGSGAALLRLQAALEAGALKTLLDSPLLCGIATDTRGFIQIFSAGAERMLGHHASSVIGQLRLTDISAKAWAVSAAAHAHDGATPADAGFKALVSRALQGDRAVCELTYLHKNGSRISAAVSVTALHDTEQRIVGYLFLGIANPDPAGDQAQAPRFETDGMVSRLARSITGRKRAKASVKESEERFRFLNELTDATRMLEDPVQVMAVMARKLGERLHASRCAYAEVMSDGEQFTILDDYTNGCGSTVGSYELSLFGANAVSQLSRGQTLIIRDVDTELSPDDGADMFNAIGIKAIIVCPLLKHDGLRAMMAVHQTTPRDWTPAEVALVQEVVACCWATIERGTVEKKLRENEALLHIAGRTAQLGGWAVDLLDARVTWSDQVCVILDVAPGSSPRLEHLFNFCVPESRNRATKAFDTCVLQAAPFDLELEMITANGRRIWARCTGEVQHNAAGMATHVHGAFQDITERKESEAARERLAVILESTTDLVSISDPAGHILYLNRAGRRALDLGLQDDLTQTLITNFLPPLPQRSGAAGRIPIAIRDGVWSGEAILRSRTGREIPVSQVILAHKAPDGSLEFLSTIMRDISELKQAQDEILRLNAGLEERVLQRTGQLQAANQELEAFSYSVSHDLRTPLSAIDGYSSLLSKNINGEADKERSKHYLTRIRAGVVQMGELIDALLSLAHVSRTGMKWDSVDLSAMATRVAQGYLERAPERQARFDIQPHLQALGDERLLQQVLDNLLGNAWKFSALQATPRIAFKCETAPNGDAVFAVQDNGAGFDMAYSEKLFGAFQRLHTANEFSGTGIGLATVHRIVTRHGGRIWAESAPGQGATFYFTLGNASP